MANRPRYVLTVEAEPGDVPAIIRLRRSLKYMLRTQGLVCVSAVEAQGGRRKVMHFHDEKKTIETIMSEAGSLREQLERDHPELYAASDGDSNAAFEAACERDPAGAALAVRIGQLLNRAHFLVTGTESQE